MAGEPPDERETGLSRRRVLGAAATAGLLGGVPTALADSHEPISDGPGSGGQRGISDPRQLPTWRVRNETELQQHSTVGPYFHDLGYRSHFVTRGVSQVNLGLLQPDDVAVAECGDNGQVQHRFVAAMFGATVQQSRPTGFGVDLDDAREGFDHRAFGAPSNPDVAEMLVELPGFDDARPENECGNVTFRVNNMLQVPFRASDLQDIQNPSLSFRSADRQRRLERDVDEFQNDSGGSLSNALPTEANVLEATTGIPSETYKAADYTSTITGAPDPPSYSDLPGRVGRLAGRLTTTMDVITFFDKLNQITKNDYLRDFDLTNDYVWLGQNNINRVADSSFTLVDFTVTLPPNQSATIHVYQNMEWGSVPNLVGSAADGRDNAFTAGPSDRLTERLDWMITIPGLDTDADLSDLPRSRLPRAELVGETANPSYGGRDDKRLKPRHTDDGVLPTEGLPAPSVTIDAHIGEPIADSEASSFPQFEEGTTGLRFRADPGVDPGDVPGFSAGWRIYRQGGIIQPLHVGEREFRTWPFVERDRPDRITLGTADGGNPAVRGLAQQRAEMVKSPFGPGLYTAEYTVEDAFGRRATAAKRFQLRRQDVADPVARMDIGGAVRQPDNGPEQVTTVGRDLTLDASPSSSRTGEFDLYEWHIQVPDPYAGQADSAEEVRIGPDLSSTEFSPAYPGRYFVELFVYEEFSEPVGGGERSLSEIRADATDASKSPQARHSVVGRTGIPIRVRSTDAGGGGGGTPGDDPSEPIGTASLGAPGQGITR